MRKFIKKIAVYALLIILVSLILDSLYTSVYSNAHIRNKVQFLLNEPPRHYDAIILGSSRAENHIVPEMFKKRGLYVYNFGITGAHLSESSLMLNLFFEKGNTADKILLQVDSYFNTENPSIGVEVLFSPYLPIKKTIYNHYKDKTDYSFILAYFPFYRYCKLDSEIGFREMFLTLVNKKTNSFSEDGFIPLDGSMSNNSNFDLPENVNNKNKYYDEIVSICKLRRVKLISFMSPSCGNSNKSFFAKLKQNVPELYDYSGVIKEDSLFATCGHLNKKGAIKFTSMLLEEHYEQNIQKEKN